MSSYLITGGAGYIGSHVVRRLHEQGADVVVLDDLSTGHRSSVGEAGLVEGSVNDPLTLDRIFGERQFDGVVHLAALALVGESVEDPAAYYRTNVEGTLCLLEAMRRHDSRTLVFSSTAAVYGEADSARISEDHPLQPTNPYGETKRVGEQAMAAYRAAYGLRYVALRYFNAAGAHSSGELGEQRSHETHLLPRLLRAACDGSSVVPIHGDDYPTADGTCVRDYVHVEDLAEAHVAALEKLRSGAVAGVPLNLGSGTGYSVQQMVDGVGRITGRRPSTRVCPRRAGDPAVLVADPRRAEATLGWKAGRSDLDSIVESAWRWQRRALSGPDRG